MNISIKTALIFFLLTTGFLKANSIAPNRNKQVFIQYYKDGIYDALEQIKKSAQEGLSEYPLKNQMKGKIIVVAEIGNLPINDIVRYKTIAIKNNYVNSMTAKNRIDNKEYIIFDTFDRMADAKYTIQRLADYGVGAKTISGGDWIKDPIIIKRIATDLKKGLLANVPVKVIKIERTIYKTNTPKISISQNHNFAQKINYSKKQQTKIIKNKTINLKKPSAKKTKDIQEGYKAHRLVMLIYKIRKENCYSVKDKYFLYNKKQYKVGDEIEGYTVEKIDIVPNKYGRRYFTVTFHGFDNKKMILKTKPCCCSDKKEEKTSKQITSSIKTKQVVKPQIHISSLTSKPKKPILEKKSQAYYYTCDFSKVRTFYVPEVKGDRKINNTSYYFLQNKKAKVLFVQSKAGYVYFKQSGLPKIGLETIAWKQICKPAQ